MFFLIPFHLQGCSFFFSASIWSASLALIAENSSIFYSLYRREYLLLHIAWYLWSFVSNGIAFFCIFISLLAVICFFPFRPSNYSVLLYDISYSLRFSLCPFWEVSYYIAWNSIFSICSSVNFLFPMLLHRSLSHTISLDTRYQFRHSNLIF